MNADVATLPAVKMDARLVKRIGVREWGMPSLCMPGKIWRSVERGTITCMLPHEDATKVKIETLPLVIIPAGEFSVLPDSWRAALWVYVQAWPLSGAWTRPGWPGRLSGFLEPTTARAAAARSARGASAGITGANRCTCVARNRRKIKSAKL